VKAALMVYATDLLGEGYDRVVKRARDDGGFDALELAAIYHHARDVSPHNPHHVQFLDGGAWFFRPRPESLAGLRMQPHMARVLETEDPLRRLMDAAGPAGLDVRAWTINFHNYTLGERYQDCATLNAFGDRLLTDLCPANPDVRAYGRTATAELAHTGVSSIIAESICYMPLEHGFHHERNAYPLGATASFLLSMCFCDHCARAAEAGGVHVDRLRRFVAAELEQSLAGATSALDDTPLEREAVAALCGGDMGGYLAARETTVTTLVAELTQAVENEGPARFVFMDSMGADDAGDQSGPLVADRSWRFGVQPEAVAAACHGLSIMGYSRDDERFRADVDAYRDRLGAETPLSMVLRAMPPDCFGPDELAAKVAYARQCGVDWIELYVYGLMRLEGLAWMREALTSPPDQTMRP
jgi:hypothetical protein